MSARASHQFTATEVRLLAEILNKLLTSSKGNDLHQLSKAPAFATLRSKVSAMRRSLEAQRGGDDA